MKHGRLRACLRRRESGGVKSDDGDAGLRGNAAEVLGARVVRSEDAKELWRCGARMPRTTKLRRRPTMYAGLDRGDRPQWWGRNRDDTAMTQRCGAHAGSTFLQHVCGLSWQHIPLMRPWRKHGDVRLRGGRAEGHNDVHRWRGMGRCRQQRRLSRGAHVVVGVGICFYRIE
jgi:hypothetical protein